jgi:small subunit ribosomal protein S15
MSGLPGDIIYSEEMDMPLPKEEKESIIREFGLHEGDTGSSQVQIAVLTRRIQQLTEHLKAHPHDEHSRRGLLKMVGHRRRHLAYLRRTEPGAYQNLIERLGLRR